MSPGTPRVAASFDGELLRRLREGKGWTLRDLAARTGLSNPYLSQLETGKTANPGIDSVAAISDVFGLSIATFIRLGASR